MSPTSPPRGPKAQDTSNSRYDSYRPRAHRSPSRGRHAEQSDRSQSRSTTRSRSRPLARSPYPQPPASTQPEDADPDSTRTPVNTVPPRTAPDANEMQSILTALFDASNRIPGVRWRAEAAAKTLADAQRNFDASKPGRHPEAAVSSNAQRLGNAKKVYESITSEHTMLLQKHGDAIVRMAQAVQPPAPATTRSDMDGLEQRIMKRMHQQLQSHKQAIRDELEERDQKLTRTFNLRMADMQTKLEKDMRKLLDDRHAQDVAVSLARVKAQLAALKIEVKTMQERMAENDSALQTQVPETPTEPVATLAALDLLRAKVQGLETVRNDVAALQDSHESINRSIQDAKSKLMSTVDGLLSHASRTDSLQEEIVALQDNFLKLQEKPTVLPEPAAEVDLQPILSDLSDMKAQIASFGSQMDVLTNKEVLDLEEEFNRRGYRALLEQSQRHDIQLRQRAADSLDIQRHLSPADAELASNVRRADSDLAQFKLSVEKRLQALLGKLATVSENCLHLQDRYESTSTQALHSAIMATMVRQYPLQEWRSACGDLSAKLQNLAQNSSRNFEALVARLSIVDCTNTAGSIAAYQEKFTALSLRADAAEYAIASARIEADRRLSKLEPRLLHDLNFEQRVLPLEKSTSALVETTAKLGSLIDTKYDSMKASIDVQLAKLVTHCAQGLSKVDVKLEGIVKDVRQLEQSTNQTTDSAILEKNLQKVTEQLDLRCDDLTADLHQKADTALRWLEEIDRRLISLHEVVGQEDGSPSADITLEPSSIVGLVKWLKTRFVSLENALHRSLADGREQPEDWLECHDQVHQGLQLRDDILDSHVQVLALGNNSLAERATVTDDGESRTVFQRSLQKLAGPTNLLRLKKSSYELESSDTPSSTPGLASPVGLSMPPPQTGSALKRKRTTTNDTQQDNGSSSVSAPIITPTRRGPGRPKKIRLPQSAASGTAGRRLDSPEAPVSPIADIDLSE